MENRKASTYLVAGIIALLLLGLSGSIVLNIKNRNALDNEKLKYQLLLSEKVNVEEELKTMKENYSDIKLQNDNNIALLSESNSKIAEKEKRINSLAGENKMLRARNKEIIDLDNSKAALEQEVAKLKEENSRLITRSGDLQNTLNTSDSEKKNLTAQLEKLQLYNTDNFLVTATKGKKVEKIVAKASSTKKLTVSFDVPQKLTETITFKIITPLGSILNQDNKGVTWSYPKESTKLTASLASATSELAEARQVVLNYAPTEKLAKGEYKIQLLSSDNVIGNCRILLR
jgi:hypothetical protein